MQSGINTSFRLSNNGIPYINVLIDESIYNTLQGDAASFFFNLFSNEQVQIGISMRVTNVFVHKQTKKEITVEEYEKDPRQGDYEKTISIIFYPSSTGDVEKNQTVDAMPSQTTGGVNFEAQQNMAAASSTGPIKREPEYVNVDGEQREIVEYSDNRTAPMPGVYGSDTQGPQQESKGGFQKPTNFLESLKNG